MAKNKNMFWVGVLIVTAILIIPNLNIGNFAVLPEGEYVADNNCDFITNARQGAGGVYNWGSSRLWISVDGDNDGRLEGYSKVGSISSNRVYDCEVPNEDRHIGRLRGYALDESPIVEYVQEGPPNDPDRYDGEVAICDGTNLYRFSSDGAYANDAVLSCSSDSGDNGDNGNDSGSGNESDGFDVGNFHITYTQLIIALGVITLLWFITKK